MSGVACLLLWPPETETPPSMRLPGQPTIELPLRSVANGNRGLIAVIPADLSSDQNGLEAPIVAGTDIDQIQPGSSRDETKPWFLSVALDEGSPPVPFDDPMVMGAMRDLQSWWLPILGDQFITHAVLFYDGVRTVGAITGFTADDDNQAMSMGGLDPWSRLGRHDIVEIPQGALERRPPPTGPSTQRSHNYVCGNPKSIAEPGTAASGAREEAS